MVLFLSIPTLLRWGTPKPTADPSRASALVMTNKKVKIKVNIPMLAKSGLEWGTRKPVLVPRVCLHKQNVGEGARAPQDCRSLARKARS